MQALPPSLSALAAYPQFLCYRLSPSASHPGKFDKFPVSPHTGYVVSAQDPTAWTNAATACAGAQRLGPGHGVAFVFTERDPFFFIDLDNCLEGANWSPLALEVLALFPGAAVEVSQSGKGLHIFGKGVAPAHGKKNTALGMEFYTEKRFVALTGLNTIGDASTEHTGALHLLAARYFPATATAQGDFALSFEPVPEWNGPTDDDELLRRALNSRSAAATFQGRASFADLWEGNEAALGKAYPDDGGRPYDGSQADAALAAHLAFWTGRNGERIKALMLRSGLVREKWDREDYLDRTIAEILARPGEVLKDKPTETAALAAPAFTTSDLIPKRRGGSTWISQDLFPAFFAGYVYREDEGAIMDPQGILLDQARFRARFGGFRFVLDQGNERSTKNAWEAFLDTEVFDCPKAHAGIFNPLLPRGALLRRGHQVVVNTYFPAAVERRAGDPAPFLDLVGKMLPSPHDREILLSFMAGCVQRPGHVITWAPVIQGCEGNGKSTLLRCLQEAVGREFTQSPVGRDFESNFNGWLENKLLVTIEEVQAGATKSGMMETLKNFIGNRNPTQLEKKGKDQVNRQVFANYMLATNHQDAIRKTLKGDGRRFAVFYTAQQSAEDKAAYGMSDAYFTRLMAWLDSGGYAIIAEFLHTYPIRDEYDPHKMAAAPVTSTQDAVVEESRSPLEQRIVEAIEEGTPGLMGGWVSSVMLDRLMMDTLRLGYHLAPSRRRDFLANLGYVRHPGLPDHGRTNNVVEPDGKKPQLYIKRGHPAESLRDASEIAKAYTAAQRR